MVNAQNWLDTNIPFNQRGNVRKLCISKILPNSGEETQELQEQNSRFFVLDDATRLKGNLDLSDFTNLEEVTIIHQLINYLVLTNCERLKVVDATNNLLKKVTWPERAPQLYSIHLGNNNFDTANLAEFSDFTELSTLFLGTNDSLRINQGIYNRWNGSLWYLKGLKKLNDLDLNATDVENGLEWLPISENNMAYFTFGNKGRTNAKVDRLKETMEDDASLGEGETMEQWAANEDFEYNFQKIESIRSFQCYYAAEQLQNLAPNLS
ncbi:hypothetical protein [endosymbiont GvMRE of Glomus versiforme]|uniref:hypothetical protein n=1 Tax=endosymbiont GvMRE of Glomus versiforme TaxID=2039283 RepID=UPI000EC4BAFA|nr:hypothetical protein [endosymbiont GvMRE of Glomus versiforme]RHZ35215.1 HET domain protein [endosymbiont GvMRE of Glomus versiforme]